MSMVGQHEPLYRRLNDVIRERFLKTADGTFCSLKMELVMSAHDLNIESIIRGGYICCILKIAKFAKSSTCT